MGKERHVVTNVTCVSCQKQDVPCPFVPSLPVDAVALASGAEKAPAKRKGPNKTETECMHRLRLEFPGAKVRFEPITLHLDAGHAYTPDVGVFLLTGEIILVESKSRGKDGFRHPSYQRARCMFDQSRLEYPQWKWRWAEKQSGSGSWSVENF
jgi:hypothetical protein